VGIKNNFFPKEQSGTGTAAGGRGGSPAWGCPGLWDAGSGLSGIGCGLGSQRSSVP